VVITTSNVDVCLFKVGHLREDVRLPVTSHISLGECGIRILARIGKGGQFAVTTALTILPLSLEAGQKSELVEWMRLDGLHIRQNAVDAEVLGDLEVVENQISPGLVTLRGVEMIRRCDDIEMKKDAFAVHFALEPQTLVEKVVDQVDDLAAATEKAFHKLTLVDDVSAGEEELAKSVELSFLKHALVLRECIREAEGTVAIDVVVDEFTVINAAAGKVQCSLSVSFTLDELAFVLRGWHSLTLISAFVAKFLRIKTPQLPKTMEGIRIPLASILSLGSSSTCLQFLPLGNRRRKKALFSRSMPHISSPIALIHSLCDNGFSLR
jgi:hypothetical protein